MEIERKGKDIVLRCSEIEAEVIAAMLDNDRAECSWDCPYDRQNCDCHQNKTNEQVCIGMAKQIWAVLTPEKVEEK